MPLGQPRENQKSELRCPGGLTELIFKNSMCCPGDFFPQLVHQKIHAAFMHMDFFFFLALGGGLTIFYLASCFKSFTVAFTEYNLHVSGGGRLICWHLAQVQMTCVLGSSRASQWWGLCFPKMKTWADQLAEITQITPAFNSWMRRVSEWPGHTRKLCLLARPGPAANGAQEGTLPRRTGSPICHMLSAWGAFSSPGPSRMERSPTGLVHSRGSLKFAGIISTV